MNTSAGLSLVGFMEQHSALDYCRQVCYFDDESDARLTHEWGIAKTRIGDPMGRTGLPDVRDIPPEMDRHIELLRAQTWFQHLQRNSLKGAEFKLVEIEPLLAMQFAINTERSAHLCNAYSQSKSTEDLLSLCLPLEQPSHEVTAHKNQKASGSLMLMTKNLSLGIDRDGAHSINTDEGTRVFVGVEISAPAPLLHVVCFRGRYYLHNGFHRAYSARLAGATHVPCIIRNVTHTSDIGLGVDTFHIDLLESQNPPTVGHFTQNRAYPVRLKSLTKVIQVSWSEYMV